MQIWILRPEAQVSGDSGKRTNVQPMMQAVLTILVMASGEPVRASTMKDLLWGEDADPGKLTSRLTTIITRLRQLLGPGRLVHQGDSYQLVVHDTDFVDLHVLRALADEARVTDLRTAALLYQYVLDNWSEEYLVRTPLTTALQAELEALIRERYGLVEQHAEVLLSTGAIRDLVKLLPPLVASAPFNEHLRGILMHALYLADRKGDALLSYREAYDLLHREIGSEPGPRLQELSRRIHENDPLLAPPPVPVPVPDAAVIASGADPSVRSAARLNGYLLNVPYHGHADRYAALLMLSVAPDVMKVTPEVEKWAARVTRYAVKDGIRQILDINAFVPSQYSAHKVAGLMGPGGTRVVYSSSDRPLVEYGRQQSADDDNVAFVHADLTEPQAILTAPETKGLINPEERTLVFIRERLNYIPDDQHPQSLVKELVDALAPGSLFAFVQATTDGLTDLAREQIKAIFDGSPEPLILRTKEETATLFGDLTLLPPGIEDICRFWTDRPMKLAQLRAYGGIGVS